ncbi:glycoside hydrolase family 3 N-terminal domain-containing protein [Okeania sp. SIO2B3]|uniref:glycoside hydrolase family 3 N-terminal domain-containing protein n=1 Tax=Okeania sp. SIO2B3 TaxID=2607784 RepID=UPI0013C166F4|nr:hypothetical protein [Okeania sp. SIO2B3]
MSNNAIDLATRIQQFKSWAKIPLLLAADIEEGVGQRFAGATWFPPPMAIAAITQTNLKKAIEYAEIMGNITDSKIASLTQASQDLIKKLLINGELQGLIIYGRSVYIETVFL